MALPLIFLFSVSKADVVEPGHLNKQFSFTNLNRFPGYKFYFIHHGYHYDRGYKPSPPDTIAVENNQRYFVSEKGSEKGKLLIRDRNGLYFYSDVNFGGSVVVSPSIDQVIEVFEIVSIKGKTVKTKKVKELNINREGKETEVKKGIFGIGGWVSNDKFVSGLMVAAIAALAGMIALFMLKRKKPKYIPMTA